MNMFDVNLEDAIGKRVNRDIFNRNGVLLASINSLITYDHIKLMKKHSITLTSDDVSSIGPYSGMQSFEQQQLIDDMVLQAGRLFEEIRATKAIPLLCLRKEIIPMIQEATDTMHLFGLFSSLQATDDYTYRHNVAVGTISGLLGMWLGLEHQERLQLTTAALLHDAGKMLIPQDILNKPDRLTEKEHDVMKKHTILGYELIKETVGTNHRQALVALQHHERMDGSGYPFGITKDKIDLFSRIVAVADVFHAMSSKRVYRNPSPFYEVLFQMEADTFGVLDPAITRLFIERMMNNLIGSSVLLTDGSEGRVLMIHIHDPTHPLVQVGNDYIDLSKNQFLRIKQIL